MPRAPFLLAILALVALVAAGAWWVGGSGAVPSADGLEPLAEAVEHAPDDAGPEHAADPADGEALVEAFDAGPRAAIAADPGPSGGAGDPPPADGLRPRGRVLDAATDEPLPHYVLELRDARGGRARAESDAEGAFLTDRALAPGPLAIRAVERGGDFDLAAELRAGADGGATGLEVRVRAGPTFVVELRPADAPRLDEHVASLSTGSNRPRTRAVVLPGEPPRVRCAPLPDEVVAGSEARLHVASRDGVWRGSAAVRAASGRQRGVVVVDLAPLAALEVRVASPDGTPLPEAFVSWTPDDGSRPRETHAGRRNQVAFEHLEPGAGTLRVKLVRWIDADIPLVLVRGERRVEDVVLAPAARAGAIRGTVVSDSGTYERPVHLRLASLDAGRGVRPLDAEVRWSTVKGARVGRFEFGSLPAGRFRLTIHEADFFAWEPRNLELEAPREDVVLVVKDAVALADLAFEPREEDGSPFPGAFTVRLAGAGETRLLPGRDGLLVVPEFPIDAPLRWRVDADGRAAAFGAWGTLSPLPSVAGRERRGAAPVLARGWSQAYRVVRSDNRRAIAGAVARVDGRDAGTTDAAGRVVLSAAERPDKVTFHHQGWRQLDGARLAPDGRSPEIEATVRLEAPKPRPKEKRK